MNYETIEMTDLASKSAQNKATFFYSDSCRCTTKNKLSPASLQTFPARNHQLLFNVVQRYAFKVYFTSVPKVASTSSDICINLR